MRVCFDEEALLWYQWERDRNPFVSREQMKFRVLEQFSTTFETSARERWMTLKQEETVREYCRDFIPLATNAPEVPDDILETAFMIGLKHHIKAGVKMLEPYNLRKMMSVAKLVEAWPEFVDPAAEEWPGKGIKTGGENQGATGVVGRVGNHNQHANGPNTQRPRQPNNQAGNQGPVRRPPNQNANNQGQGRGNFRRFLPAEYARNKAEGLCYQCGGRYGARHVCANKELMVLVIQEEEDEAGEEVEELEKEDEVAPEFAECAALSAKSAMGISSPRTIKLQGVLRDVKATVLIDSGATHNFIDLKLMKELGLKADQSRSFGVITGSEGPARGHGVCKNVMLKMQDYSITSDFLPLDLNNVDIILGIQWLETLGETRVNWKLQTMKIPVEGEVVVLQGEPGLCSSEISYQALRKTLEQQEYGMVVECREVMAVKEGRVVPNFLSSVLKRFGQVFEEPEGLPPSRGKEHAIVLNQGSNPVSVRPFTYPQAQKAEIERQVTAMLKAGIIQESVSPFSSPVLLVKKKDGSWRFCVDYRGLNKVTVMDSYPIPMIDQLLDELRGAVVFSKLDLRSGYHQILVKPEDVPKTAFRTHDMHYEFLVMPFGLSNAPATFQSLMNDVFRPYLRKFVLVFFDDILVYSRNREEHVTHVRLVLEKLQQHQLYANHKKCEFGCESIEYLGHVITATGVAADESKVRAMTEWPIPKNVKELRGFLGLTGYYRKFVQNYGMIAMPLTELLKKDKFGWEEKATMAFEGLKHAMVTMPV